MAFAEWLFWISAVVIGYVYAGYPAVLWVLGKCAPVRTSNETVDLPSVTLVVSAFNEEDVIREKIENSLSLNYPPEKLEILVVSDCSSDGTDEIVRKYEGGRVRLLRMAERGGKTLGLNAAVAESRGSVVVFSDANAMYDADAVSALVSGFADPAVGAVIGESTYSEGGTDSERSEGLYWRYETWLKELESRIGSVVGGDGAIYAVRRSLYVPMAADALSDFVNPLQVVRGGFRVKYERRAVSVEGAADRFRKEFKRKVRIVNRAWRATLKMKDMLNPLRHGWFSVALFSHKVLRWLLPVFLLALFLSSLFLWDIASVYFFAVVSQSGFYCLAIAAAVKVDRADLPRFLYIPYYFCLVNIASAKGVFDALRGEKYVTWDPARVH